MTKLQPALFLPIALIAVPLIEIALFVVIGGQIGLLATIAVVVATAVAGTMLLRHQGLAALEKARRSAEAGELPVAALVDAVFLFVAGLLLLTPGFLTDAFGLALFVPPLRGALAGLCRDSRLRIETGPPGIVAEVLTPHGRRVLE